MEYSVLAKENSVSGGTGRDAGTYNRGTLLVITCSPEDTWSLGPGNGLTCNANALDDRPYQHTPNGIDMNAGTLVGSLDDGKSFFPVGILCQLSITANNTQLKLYCWDSDNGNNSGAISAHVLSY